MQVKKRFKILTSGMILLSLFSCEYYLGINQQPDFTEKNPIEGLNIFGVLRPDSIFNYNKSFVYVQKMWPVLEMDTFAIIHDVTVRVYHIVEDIVTDSVDFPLVPSDSLFPDTLYRPLERFTPQPGEHYRLMCRYPGLPDAEGELVFPGQPMVVANSLSINERNIRFRIAADTLIRMIDIYLVDPYYSPFLLRIVPSGQQDVEVELNLEVDPSGRELMIFGYDTHMAAYYGNSNTAINFNKYRTTISTLESGYGVFGAVNFSSINLTHK
jgi:hypothetical protein